MKTLKYLAIFVLGAAFWSVAITVSPHSNSEVPSTGLEARSELSTESNASPPRYITNWVGRRITNDIVVQDMPGDRVYVNLVGFSREFAEEYNYPDQYVHDFAPGIHGLIYQEFDYAHSRRCSFYIFINKDFGIYRFPTPISNLHLWDGSMLAMPVPLPNYRGSGLPSTPENIQYLNNQGPWAQKELERNFVKTSFFTQIDDSGRSQFLRSYLKLYYNKYFRNIDVYQISTWCATRVPNTTLLEKLSLWGLKTGNSVDKKMYNFNKDRFVEIEVPSSFLSMINEIVRLGGREHE